MEKSPATSFDGRATPDSGAVMIPIDLDFTSENTYVLDLQNFVSLARINGIQSIIVDNQSDDTVFVNISRTNMEIGCTPRFVTFAHIAVPNPATITFTVPSVVGFARVFLCNFPVGCSVAGLMAS